MSTIALLSIGNSANVNCLIKTLTNNRSIDNLLDIKLDIKLDNKLDIALRH